MDSICSAFSQNKMATSWGILKAAVRQPVTPKSGLVAGFFCFWY